jgi:hypothetical protein
MTNNYLYAIQMGEKYIGIDVGSRSDGVDALPSMIFDTLNTIEDQGIHYAQWGTGYAHFGKFLIGAQAVFYLVFDREVWDDSQINPQYFARYRINRYYPLTSYWDNERLLFLTTTREFVPLIMGIHHAFREGEVAFQFRKVGPFEDRRLRIYDLVATPEHIKKVWELEATFED